MILDITYWDKSPEQIQNVRMTTLYTDWTNNASPEIVIQFNEIKSQRNIDIAEIKTLMVTDD